MRTNKILKVISYCLIPILVLIIVLSVFYEIGKNVYKNKIDADTYLKTDTFLNMYMSELSSKAQIIIYHNDDFNSVYDGNIKICYRPIKDSYCYQYSEYELKDNYYLIQYRDLALTNVELTTSTDTIEEIKNFINNNEGKKVNILNGVVESDSEMFANKAIQYFERFENTYYSIERKDNVVEYVIKENNYSEVVITEDETYSYNPNEYEYYDGELIDTEDLETVETKEWYTTTIKDFQIYSSYKEELIEIQNTDYYKMLIEDLKVFEPQMLNAIPIASVLLVIILIYLIVAIGHTKEKDEIDFNDLDKIPIEVVLLVGGTIVLCIMGIGVTSLDSINGEYYRLSNSLLLAGYFISYIFCAVMGVTIIKRIKAKNLIKNSITGKLCKWCFNICKKVLNKIKELLKRINLTYKEIVKNVPNAIKLTVGMYFYVIFSICIIGIFNFFGFIVVLVISGILIYGILKEIDSYNKIKKHLKEMYEGNNTQKLDERDFTNNFKEIVEYINDISRGYENAIEKGIKSERLKTELITNVSHDIKTPLTSIINYVDLLKKENIENEKAKEYIEVLDNKSQRLKKLTEDLVEASKASSGNVKLNIEKINVIELLKQSTGEFEDKFKQKNLEIILNYPEDEICINADNRYMYRVIENLFSNISKYALEASRVYIDVKKIENTVKIDIKNISKERLNITEDELMQRFVRGDKARTTEGSGLGISISKSLTEIQKGKFNLQIDGDLFKVGLEFEIA